MGDRQDKSAYIEFMEIDQMGSSSVFSDGTIEERILNYLIEHDGNESGIIRDLPEGAVVSNFSAARSNLLKWYPFLKDASVLEIGSGMGALTTYLVSKCQKVVAVEQSAIRAWILKQRCKNYDNLEVFEGDLDSFHSKDRFDYVLLIGVLEYAGVAGGESDPWKSMLQKAKDRLKPDGKLLLGIENRFGLKYWCGAAEDHTGIPFDSIDDYQKSKGKTDRYGGQEGVRTFSRSELDALLKDADFSTLKYYYPFPDYKFPMLVLSDNSDEAEQLVGDVKYTYPEESTLIADERRLWPQMVRDGMLGVFANSFFVEASFNEEPCNVNTVSLKRDYKPEFRLMTVLTEQGAYRETLDSAAENHLMSLVGNTGLLSRRGINCIDQSLDERGRSTSQRMDLPRADKVFAAFIREGNNSRAHEMLELLQNALRKSSDSYYKEGKEILKDGYIDLTFRNSFIKDRELIFFDQEWCFHDIPLDFILYRSVRYALSDASKTEKNDLTDFLGLADQDIQEYEAMEKDLLESMMDPEMCGWFDRSMYQERLTLDASIERKLQNKTGHIELLLQSERDLQAAVAQKERDYEELKSRDAAAFASMVLEKDDAFRSMIQEKDDAYDSMVKEKDDAYASIVQEKDDAFKSMVQEKDDAFDSMVKEKEAAFDSMVAEKEAAFNAMRQENAAAYESLQEEKNGQIAQLEQTVRNKEGHIELLLESDRELERIKASRSWRFMGGIWKIRDILIPKGSKRRLFGKMLVKFIKHPIRFLSKCTPTRIGKFFNSLRHEGPLTTSRRLDECLIGVEIQPVQIELGQIDDSAEEQAKTAADYAPLHVPQQENPLVSIIIPVFNQFDYTYLCIKSILDHSGDIAYEIIVADDCSTDLTTQIEEVITGLHTIHNPENLRFLLNCNNAAKEARGRYILFLNNDTQVQDNWLAPLVELIERSDDIGMVGSKLVYPDGSLQEAGGILWKDASAWNYGNRSDPALPEYNYVKEVDYISGASIMIRRSLWEEIGGFDERFAPAYYEDDDLAFEVRKHGYKVMYQPASVVVHFEGVSNGTDIETGQKAYQLENQEKFLQKWKDVLEREHFANAENVFQARDRSARKETVLVIDHYIPQYDKDAGSRSMDSYLVLLQHMGYHVLFMGDNFYYDQHYAPRYEQLGVEMLCGNYYYSNWKNWLSDHAEYFDYIFLSRPHISIHYIDFFREKFKAKILYFVQDLHFLRLEREYEISHDPEVLKAIKKFKDQELHIMNKSDIVLTFSDVEKKIIDEIIPGNKGAVVPIFCYDTFPSGKVSFAGKHDIIFVGGFGHHPNEDGILWFLDMVWGELRRELKEARLIIIGSKPTQKVLERQSEDVIVTGFVSDEELEEHYRNCRICIIPLRYGAGVKGKTLEAMYHRVPIVSTTIGVEGLTGIEEYIEAADDATEFAGLVKKLYQNDKLAEKTVMRYIDYLKKYYSMDAAERTVKELM